MHCKYTLYILILAIAVNSTFSKKNIWLALRFKKDTLELKCQVLNPNLSINIYSTHEHLIGQCLTFPSAECYCFRNYSKIAFDENTNETILTLWRLPNYNGNWTCRHGVSSNDPSATVDIDLGNVCKTEDGYRHDSVIVICVVSFVILMVMCGCFIYNRQTFIGVRRREGGNSAERAHLDVPV